MNHHIHCIIPARKGSKRLVGKNTRLLLGKPLISWTIEEAIRSSGIASITISTDDESVMEIAKNYGKSIEILKRPEILAADDTTTVDVVLHFVSWLNDKGENVKHIMLLQPTSPLRTATHIDEAVNNYFSNLDKIDSLISVTKSAHPPWWQRKIGENGVLEDVFKYDKSKYKRSQDFPQTYIVNGAIYIIKAESFIKYKGFETDKTLAYIMESNCSIDIDTEFDLMLAEKIAKTYY
ncbi:cytidylyltransferase domain-containing protein [Pseudobacteroides cellulosolvens]|uniref:N-acylneuraminate cytidylyltransferase n=1 Tax=Pseudobacteroides cellulosolvens ATCC 35603 = DSM 2933 TaxID=398512 RepID=A0A0L6JSB2_9FIRM|nr:acylneuraminate cytidylyltransferase family protein [Pseudobacteroides cellulosolvens]KNY28615.1 N-acylneuraminate cytidylyltransferase [Pseudobacteroides cellulosolvens ATCC 35603 = DSM 2933]